MSVVTSSDLSHFLEHGVCRDDQPPPESTRLRVREFTQSRPGRVDREAGVIHDAKILGPSSANKRDYRRALKGSARKYEGARVFIGHPRRDELSEDRAFSDWAGVLRNVHERADGLYGDVVLRKEGRSFREILEAAERFPTHFGLSHVADTKFHRDKASGVDVVESIETVFSVDIVCEPATTAGVFESSAGLGIGIGVLHARRDAAEAEALRQRADELQRRLDAVDARNELLERAQRGEVIAEFEESRRTAAFESRWNAAAGRPAVVARGAGSTYSRRWDATVEAARRKETPMPTVPEIVDQYRSMDAGMDYERRFKAAVELARKKVAADLAKRGRCLVDRCEVDEDTANIVGVR